MTELTFEEQDLIIDKLIEKYFSKRDYIEGYCGEHNKTGLHYDIKIEIPHIKNMCLYKSDPSFSIDDELSQASIEFSYNDVHGGDFTIQELQQKYFQDILTPTENELIMFELSEGFEWPLSEKFLKKDNKE